MSLSRSISMTFACCAATLVVAPSVHAQAAQRTVRHPRHRAAAPADSTRRVHTVTWPVVPVLPGALLPASRIVAYYGNPLSTGMGILGALPPAQMLDKLAATAKEWAHADSTHPVRPALQLIATVAQEHKGPDGLYRVRHSDSLIAKVAGWAQSRDWLLFLDVQVGWSTVPAELQRLIPWLKKPWVHLALDPEFAMYDGRIPGKKFGTLDAKDINYAIDLLARIVDEEHLPPKVLVVHRFTDDMLTNYKQIKRDPRVQVVIDMDGNGGPAVKKHMYDLIIAPHPVQFTGLKLFYKQDRPMMTLDQVLGLYPIPLYIQYQ
ncbi:MAG TPA: hypothetical protein VGM77_02550 [Gemmatimonadales bacterium]|jgi:hypothetical protein